MNSCSGVIPSMMISGSAIHGTKWIMSNPIRNMNTCTHESIEFNILDLRQWSPLASVLILASYPGFLSKILSHSFGENSEGEPGRFRMWPSATEMSPEALICMSSWMRSCLIVHHPGSQTCMDNNMNDSLLWHRYLCIHIRVAPCHPSLSFPSFFFFQTWETKSKTESPGKRLVQWYTDSYTHFLSRVRLVPVPWNNSFQLIDIIPVMIWSSCGRSLLLLKLKSPMARDRERLPAGGRKSIIGNVIAGFTNLRVFSFSYR